MSMKTFVRGRETEHDVTVPSIFAHRSVGFLVGIRRLTRLFFFSSGGGSPSAGTGMDARSSRLRARSSACSSRRRSSSGSNS